MSFLYVLGLGLVVLLSYPVANGTNSAAAVATGVFLIGSVVLYFCPSIVAAAREHPRKVPVIILNVLLGWTILGWVGALVWAYSAPERPASTSDGNADELAELREHAAKPGWTEVPEPLNAPPAGLKRCPYCAEDVKVEAIKCKHCGSDLTAAPAG